MTEQDYLKIQATIIDYSDYLMARFPQHAVTFRELAGEYMHQVTIRGEHAGRMLANEAAHALAKKPEKENYYGETMQ